MVDKATPIRFTFYASRESVDELKVVQEGLRSPSASHALRELVHKEYVRQQKTKGGVK